MFQRSPSVHSFQLVRRLTGKSFRGRCLKVKSQSSEFLLLTTQDCFFTKHYQKKITSCLCSLTSLLRNVSMSKTYEKGKSRSPQEELPGSSIAVSSLGQSLTNYDGPRARSVGLRSPKIKVLLGAWQYSRVYSRRILATGHSSRAISQR